MEAFCHQTIATLEHPHAINSDDNADAHDPLSCCGSAALSLLTNDPKSCLELADAKLHVFPFKDVDHCWHRLYTDASVLLTARVCLEPRQAGWLDHAVRWLDMALIMTGGAGRRDVIERFFAILEGELDDDDAGVEDGDGATTGGVGAGLDGVHHVAEPTQSNGALEKAPRKRRKLEGPDSDLSERTFDTTLRRPLDLEYPIKRPELSLSKFERHLEGTPAPHVMLNALDHWPALNERPWRSPNYLLRRTLGGRRLVPVELGRSYTDEDWGQAIVPFAEFMSKFIDQPGDIGYLAQHDLFAQVPSLRNDISIPDFCYTSPPPPAPGTPLHGKEVKQLEEPLLNAWFGPAGTISPLHTDPYHNILCQVVGKKYVRLYPPEETPKLYPRGIEGNGIDMSNTSSVPVEMIEMDLGIEDDEDEDLAFPLFAEACFVETVLSEGESLYIPVGWWHYVRSLTISFSVSFWWN